MIIGITDRSLYPEEEVYLNKIGFFLNSQLVDYLIIREKDLSQEAYAHLLEKICLRNSASKHKIIVHTHKAIARRMGIKRVHLPEALLSSVEQSDKAFIYSVSLHPKLSVLNPLIEGCDFFFVSPIYETSCKPGSELVDHRLLRALQECYKDKLVLLGGLDKDKIIALKNEGYQNFAIRSGLELFIQS